MPQNVINTVRAPKIGDIYMVGFNGKDSEQSGYRPAVIIQNNTGNKYSPNVIVLPLTTSLKKMNQPTHVVIYSNDSGLIKNSMVLCENPECVSKDRLNKYVTTLNNKYMSMIATAYLLATSVISFVSPDLFTYIKGKADMLNNIDS